MAKKKLKSVPLDLHLEASQTKLLQAMIDNGLYGTVTVPNATGGRYILSHVAMNSPLSYVAMNSALWHVAMNAVLP